MQDAAFRNLPKESDLEEEKKLYKIAVKRR
jgi:hypothetical protein